jgi:hypothetical protein
MGRRTAAARIKLSVAPEGPDGRSLAVQRGQLVRGGAPLFEAKVTVLERGRGHQSAAIQRLRASKLQAERHQLINDRIDGREWLEDNASDYEALKTLEENSSRYQSHWDRPWQQMRYAVDPLGQYTDEQVSAHFFGEGNGDRLNRPHYLGAFLQGVLETWDELKAEVEAVSLPAPSRGEVVAAGNSDITASVAPAVSAAPVEPPDLPKPASYSAHSVPQAASVFVADPQTDHTPGRKDAVTLLLASVGQTSEPTPDYPQPRSPAPPARPKLWIVRVAEDTYTTAREWLARERPIDYGN